MKAFSLWMILAATLPLAAVSTSCGDSSSQEASALGNLQLRLLGHSSSGLAYRLRQATFEITGTSTATLSSETDRDAESLVEELPVGPYEVSLSTGWFLEKQASDGTFERVKAVLTSANPTQFSIAEQQTTKVQFAFKAGDDVIEVGDGQLEIGIVIVDQNGGCPAAAWRHIATLPTTPVKPSRVDGIQRIDSDPDTLVVATQNDGSVCGGGTPAAIWRVELDPATHQATSIAFQQSLDRIQTTRRTLFESSDGTLFVGGGWCGPTPPYYSIDHGRTFLPATGGDYPPNSSFAFAELNGEVYVGTGYNPYPASVYRWTGGGAWTKAFSFPRPHNILQAMAVHRDQLFVGASIYEDSTPCQTASPVYVSSDGQSFAPTNWPPCSSAIAMASTGERLLALAYAGDRASVFDWVPDTQSWTQLAAYPFDNASAASNLFVSHGKAFYAGAVPEGSSSGGLYRSTDGTSWTPIIEQAGLRLDTLTVEGDTLYAAEVPASGGVKIYSLALCD